MRDLESFVPNMALSAIWMVSFTKVPSFFLVSRNLWTGSGRKKAVSLPHQLQRTHTS